MEPDRFELDIGVGELTFRAAGDATSVMDAFAEFKEFANSAPARKTTGLTGGSAERDGASDGGASELPLALFVKRSWPSQAAKATAIVMWAKHRENRTGLKPSDIEAHWRKTPGKTPANPSQVCATAVAQGWLHSEGNGVYSVTGHGEAMVNSTPQSS